MSTNTCTDTDSGKTGEDGPTRRVSMATLWEKYGNRKLTEAVPDPPPTPTPRDDGFLIRFKLSRAYKNIERQEIDASKPAIKPFRRRRRRRHHHHHHHHHGRRPVAAEKDPEIKEDRSQKRLPSRKGGLDVGNEREREGSTPLPITLSSSRPDYSEAVLEWERRNEARKQQHRQRWEKLKSAPTTAVGSNSKSKTAKKSDDVKVEPPATAQKPALKRRLSAVEIAVKKVEKISLMYPSKKSTPRPKSAAAVAQSPPEQTRVNASNPYDIIRRLGDINCKENQELLERDPYAETGGRRGSAESWYTCTSSSSALNSGHNPWLSTASNSRSASALNNSSRPTSPTKTPPGEDTAERPTVGGWNLLRTKPSTGQVLESKGARKAKPVAKKTTPKLMPENDEEEGDKSKACRYLYTMCNCQKATGADTFFKLRKSKKVSGVIEIYGCPEEEQDNNDNSSKPSSRPSPDSRSTACPFCSVFPHQRIKAWLQDVATDMDPERVPEERTDNWTTQLTHTGLVTWRGFRRRRRKPKNQMEATAS